MPQKAILYARVAQLDSDYSRQLEVCRAYARQQGYTVIAEFVDNGVSGLLPMSDRPRGHEMLDLLKRRAAETVIVSTADRLSRNLAYLLELTQRWQQNGIELHYVDWGLDTLKILPTQVEYVSNLRTIRRKRSVRGND